MTYERWAQVRRKVDMAARSLRPKPDALDAIRARKGLTLGGLADVAGCSSRTMDNIMAGKPVLFSTIELIARKLDVAVSEISEMADSLDTSEGATYGVTFKLTIPHKDFNQDRLQTFADLLAKLLGGSISDAAFTEGSTLVTVQLTEQQIRNLLDLLPEFRVKAKAVLDQTAALSTLAEQLERQQLEYPLVDAVVDVTFPDEAKAIPEDARGKTITITA